MDLSMDMLLLRMMLLDYGKRVSEMVDEDKEPCGASGSTKQPTQAPGTKLVQNRVLQTEVRSTPMSGKRYTD